MEIALRVIEGQTGVTVEAFSKLCVSIPDSIPMKKSCQEREQVCSLPLLIVPDVSPSCLLPSIPSTATSI